MSFIHVSKLGSVAESFMIDRVIPNTFGLTKAASGALAGAAKYLGVNPNAYLAQNIAGKLNAMGAVDPNGNVDIELLKYMIDGAFDAAPTFAVANVNLDRGDGDAIKSLLEKHKNE